MSEVKTPEVETPAVAGTPNGDTAAPGTLLGSSAEGPAESESGGGNTPATLEDMNLPEGVVMDEAKGTKFLGLINGNLSPADLGRQILEMQMEEAKKADLDATEASNAEWNTLQKEWKEKTEALPDIGGTELKRTLSTIKQGLTLMGATDKTFQAFDITGAGNHPEVIRVLYALTQSLVEHPPVTGTVAPPGNRPAYEVMFPTHNKGA